MDKDQLDMKKLIFITMLLILVISTNSCERGKVKVVCGISETAQIGINHLQPLVDALEKYKADHGKYPTSDTKDFIPKYIDRLPIILNSVVSKEIGSEPIYNVLRHAKLESKTTSTDETGQTFELGFYTKDDRFCLTGRNNICEFRSEWNEWRCYR
jgi:hypothetical protein